MFGVKANSLSAQICDRLETNERFLFTIIGCFNRVVLYSTTRVTVSH
jgi:hypothetical protein